MARTIRQAPATAPGVAAKAQQATGKRLQDALAPYRRRRDFRTTPEPRDEAAARPRRVAGRHGRALAFVVQKHAARRLHYDFRLELDGTLKSWAVPKGPSLDPADKRMAVHVEDHPVDYAEFEGVIPPGQYGAGTVIVWDRGAWIPEGDPRAAYRAGKLTFELRGEKLRGHWTLVRMHGNRQKDQDAWLLIKGRDEASVPITELDVVEAMPDSVLSGAAGRAPRKGASARKSGKPKAAEDVPLPRGARAARLPLTLSPQLATLVETPPADEQDWRYEIKFDGYRLLARIDGKGVRLFTREGNDWTSRLQAVARDVGALGLPDGWLDGEIVVLGKHGETDFQALQNAFRTSSVDAIQYFVFDLPFYAGHDLRKVRLAQRRGLLRRLFERNTSPRLQFSEEFEAGPADMLDAACRMKLEGVIGKRADSHYVSARSKTWIKLKCTLRQEFVIGGFTDPRGSRHGIGSLLLGVHASNGHLRYAGNVGTGFDERMLSTLRAKLDGLVTDTTPFDAPPASLNVHWVRPKLVAEVSFGSWTRDGRVRHSVFHGLRSDKPASAVILEQPAEVPAGPARPSHKHKHGHKPTAAGGRVAISHADRIVDQATGITKGELVRYYERVAPLMLPHLRDRPVALVRAPDGVGGEQFFQRHGDTLRVDGIHVLDAGLWPGHPGLLEIVSAPALVAAAQLNAIEFHTWNASKRSIAKPNRIVFDLDPGKGLSWAHMREGAAMVKALLDELGLVSFLKTSGGKGLHVVVPVTPRAGWDEVKDFAHAVVLHIAQLIPQRFVAKRGAERRVGKIFIDYLRNGIGATTVAAFSVRARPGLGLSIPVGWDELESLESAAEWSVSNCGRRLEALASRDPWEAYARTRQSISRAAARLASAPG
ncbi:ATP-dependent DNA ligase [Cupriavidus sp. USMAA2-4]|uniref:DNA ligase D n=1 Tax=Cupriavidus sp. USMAA2-4 TaxID=876364 RepID=UPI0008A69030|nr:DNA ligase D [Cupriavidus sp. USMAA2-4]AOY96270.1 ATP-dependent DNA ligase [Cupriavidus sp. USMAA2-4]